jgi:Major Facilitator Superfamily
VGVRAQLGRGAFLVLALLSLIWVLIWLWYFRDVPAAPPLTAEELATLPLRSRGNATKPVPWFKLFRRMLPVTAVDFCNGWTLWLFLSWIPSFFYQNYQQNLMQSAFYSAGVFLAGVIGDTLGGVVSDQILQRTGDRAAARRNVIVAGMLGGFLFLIPVMLVHDVNVAAASLAAAFFSVELVVAPIWAVPMDIAPKYSGSASGMMNFGFGVAGIISPSIAVCEAAFGILISACGNQYGARERRAQNWKYKNSSRCHMPNSEIASASAVSSAHAAFGRHRSKPAFSGARRYSR